MAYTMHRFVVLLNILSYADLSAISMVYNFRIAQITKQKISERSNEEHSTVVALFFDQWRKKYNGTHQNFIGGLSSYIYNVEPCCYCRIDAAVSHIQEKIHHITTFTGTETDDILFTVGYTVMQKNHVVLTLSGLFGVPTHKIFRLQHIDFGYGQVGMGIQLDGSYALDQARALLYGARYIYFIPRNARDTLHQQHIFTLGNIGDVLVAYKNSWHKHGLEFGYTSRFRFGAHSDSKLDTIAKKTDYARSNFYIVYKYKFLTPHTSNRLLCNISYGFDHRPKIFGNKYIITLWTSWNIGF